MSSSTPPSWYEPGDLAQTFRHARDQDGVSQANLVEVLNTHEFDVPRERIERLVAATPEDITPTEDPDPPKIDDSRDVVTRFVGVNDVAYFSPTEFATIAGAVLSRYAGNFRLPDDADDVVVDLFWNRQYTTDAFRTIPLPPGESVGLTIIEEVAHGATSPPTGRSASVIGVLTNTDYTDAARDAAAGTDIELFGADRLERWFRDAKLTPEIAGILLDEGERSDEEIDDILATLPPMPDRLRDLDPLTDSDLSSRTEITPDWETSEDGSSSLGRRSIPVVDSPADPGQRGELYADPEEDGDYRAVDEFIDRLGQDGGSK